MYKIQKLRWFFIVCLHILRIHVRSRENRSYGDFNTCFDPHAPSWSSVQLTVKLHSLIQVPTHWTEALHFLDCVSSTVYRSPYFTNDFEHRRTFLYCYMCAPFWHLFTFAHRFFLLPSLFYRTFPLSHLYAHFFHRPQLYSSSRLMRRNYLFVCFNFLSVSILPQRQASFTLCTSLPLSHPSVVVIMSIFSTLEWCPPSVIYNKISVFLSIDVQSTMVRC